MAESLPLIPEKGAACSDVRGVLREVFRPLDQLPPLARATHDRATTLPPDWIKKCDATKKELWEHEDELRQQYARRLSREPLPNIYRLQPTSSEAPDQIPWREQHGILARTDLRPTILQNCEAGDALWVRNILARSSGDLHDLEVKGVKMASTPPILYSETSFQSMSIGEYVPPAVPPSPARPAPPPAPEHVLCIPPSLDFINFTVGALHTQCIRLVNVCKLEVRVSLRPPRCRELDLELCGARLTLTSGAAAELKVNFRPRDVRVLHDEVVVRVSTGRELRVPVTCYMQPPLLDILVPAVSSSVFSCTAESDGSGVMRSADCLELGARLLGDVHCVQVLFHCAAEHASFFLLTEDAWLSFSLDVVTSVGSLVAPPFVVWPAWWGGGGCVRACAWCVPAGAGLHAAALRLVASTAVVRPLHLIADALYFRPEHITIEAQQKDYDICSEDDPACEHYVHLGTAFPRRALSNTVQLINHSPIVYYYYWSVRPWGECSCWEERDQNEEQTEESDENKQKKERKHSKDKQKEGNKKSSSSSEAASDESDSSGLCVGAKEAREKERMLGRDTAAASSASLVRVEPARGSVAARAASDVHVCVPDVGDTLGVQRAVLMLILKGIPKESLPEDYDAMILRTDVVESDAIPGVKKWSHEVCEVVCSQMEVWWEVAPVRFAIDPPTLHLNYSRRVSAVNMTLRATQLFGSEGVWCWWRTPAHLAGPEHVRLRLAPAHSCAASLLYNLPALPNEYPETHHIKLESDCGAWRAESVVEARCSSRAASLRPARHWLGVVPPGAALRAQLQLHNDTYQHIYWWATVYRWHGENVPGVACVGRAPCDACRQRDCTCDIIRPARGAAQHGGAASIQYSVHAPQRDGCVATLVRAVRTGADVARAAGRAGAEGRASLLAYRVLAPRLVLRALPCGGDKRADCSGCVLDPGARGSPRGTAVLRPGAALALGRRTCYRLQLTNLTPIDTAVEWEPALEEDYVKVIFVPKEFNVRGYQQVTIQVVLEARRVCARRVGVRRARVLHAHAHLYLLVDAAVSGLELVCEVPLGGAEHTDCTAVMRRTQAEVYPWNEDKVPPQTFEEIFAEEDRKRAVRVENTCRCKFEWQYVPPPAPRPRPPPLTEDDYPPIQILDAPPPLSRVCACVACGAPPPLPTHPHPPALQLRGLPLREVRTRVLTLRNTSAVSGAWRARLREHARMETAHSLDRDAWARGVRECGVALRVWPPGGVLAAGAAVSLTLSAYADCWGLYRDQLAIQVDRLEAIVVDVWVEAVGAPLHFALNISHTRDDSPVLCWLSRVDPLRSLRVKNVSRAELLVLATTTTLHESDRDALPFRLYLRLVDVPPPTCPCCDVHSDSWSGSDRSSSSSSLTVEYHTGVELLLAADLGPQCDAHYQVSPAEAVVAPGAWSTWRVGLRSPGPAPPPRAALLLRALPQRHSGRWWSRGEPPLQAVQLRAAPRHPLLELSCCELRVAMCALHLPAQDVLRVRRRFHVRNVGCGVASVSARTEPPWELLPAATHPACGAGCVCAPPAAVRAPLHHLELQPRSSLEMCAEVRVETAAWWPAPAPPAPCGVPSPPYEPRRVLVTQLHFYDDHELLKSLPLVLELQYPALQLEPACLCFGVVTDGDTRKSYFSVSHTSRTETLEVVVCVEGCAGFSASPRALALGPGRAARVYVQYCARWHAAPDEATVRVRARGPAGVWCGAAAAARASPARAAVHRHAPADATDDTALRPPHAHYSVCP